MSRRLLVVCTANVCRSPVAARLLERAFDSPTARDGMTWIVSSAGTSPLRVPPDANTLAAAAAVGLDVRAHEPRHIDRTILQSDGADLVLTMTRAHLRDVVAMDVSSWPRTFTLKELVRRAGVHPPAGADEPLETWLDRLGADRRAATLLKPDPADDVADPYGLPRRFHDEMVRELVVLTGALGERGPWRHPRPRD